MRNDIHGFLVPEEKIARTVAPKLKTSVIKSVHDELISAGMATKYHKQRRSRCTNSDETLIYEDLHQGWARAAPSRPSATNV